MNLYKHHTERELFAVLEQSTKLTYEAQLNLSKEIRKRSLGVSTDVLDAQILENEKAIHSFENLKDLGFTFHQDEVTGVITIKRATMAKVMDIVSIVLGGVLLLGGLIYFWLLIAVFFGDNEFTLSNLFLYVLMISAGMLGFKMLNGVHRFLDYIDFSLVQSGDKLRITKGGLQGEQIVPLDALIIEEDEEGELILSAGEIEIMRSAQDNLLYKHTLQALLQKLITNR